MNLERISGDSNNTEFLCGHRSSSPIPTLANALASNIRHQGNETSIYQKRSMETPIHDNRNKRLCRESSVDISIRHDEEDNQIFETHDTRDDCDEAINYFPTHAVKLEHLTLLNHPTYKSKSLKSVGKNDAAIKKMQMKGFRKKLSNMSSTLARLMMMIQTILLLAKCVLQMIRLSTIICNHRTNLKKIASHQFMR